MSNRFCMMAAVWIGCMAWAEEAPAPLHVPARHLRLEECMRIALQNNADIRLQRFDVAISEAALVESKGPFDPVVDLTVNKQERESPTSRPGVEGASVREDDNLSYNVSLNQRLITGTRWDLMYGYNRSESNDLFQLVNPIHSVSLTLQLTQPLLKGAWQHVNQAEIRISSNNRDISRFQLRQIAMDTILAVHNAYWELVAAVQELDVRKQSLQLAQDLLVMTENRVRLGAAAQAEILQAKATVASREEAVIVGDQAVQAAEDELRRAMNDLTDPEAWDVPIVPVDRPDYETVRVDPLQVFQDALMHQPAYQKQYLRLQNMNVRMKRARMNRLPQLDLNGGYSLSGLDGDYGGAFGDVTDADFQTWSIGLHFSMPVGNRSPGALYRQARLEQEKEMLAFQTLERDIWLQAREACREVSTSLKRIHANHVSRRLAEDQLEKERQRLDAGYSTRFQVSEFQEDLAQEQSKEIRAIIDYKKALMQLETVRGTTLEAHHIHLD